MLRTYHRTGQVRSVGSEVKMLRTYHRTDRTSAGSDVKMLRTYHRTGLGRVKMLNIPQNRSDQTLKCSEHTTE